MASTSRARRRGGWGRSGETQRPHLQPQPARGAVKPTSPHPTGGKREATTRQVRMGVLPNLIFLLAAAVGLVVYSGVLQFLYAYSEVKELSTAQYGVAAFYGAVLALSYCDGTHSTLYRIHVPELEQRLLNISKKVG